MNEILVRSGVQKEIHKTMGHSYSCIRLALRGMTKTELAHKIRAKAIELGGVEVVTKK